MGIKASAQIPGLTDDSQAFKQQQQKPALRLLVEETKHNRRLKTNNTGKKTKNKENSTQSLRPLGKPNSVGILHFG